MIRASRLLALQISSIVLALPSALIGCSQPYAQEDVDVASEAITASPVCVNIRRGVLGDVADTQIASNHPDKNYGSDHVALAGKVNGGIRQTLMRFDLGAVAPGAVVTSAKLVLTQTNNGCALVDVHRVTAPWQEDTVTWNSLAGSFSSPGELSFSNGPGATVSADVTSLVKAWLSGAQPNDGLLLAQDGTLSTSFATSEVAKLSDRPRLKVCFVPPAPTTCQTPGQTLSFSSTDILDWFVDSQMLATDGINVFASAAVSNRIYTVDPAGFNVVSFFNAPLVGNTNFAVNPSNGDFFYGHATCLSQCDNYRLASNGAVELGPVALSGLRFGQIWDKIAGELHSTSLPGATPPGGVIVSDENYNTIQTYGAPQLGFPTSIAINYAHNRIVVTDGAPLLVHIFDRATRTWLKSFDGHTSGDPFTEGSLSLAVSEAGTVWVADRVKHRVVAFDMDGNWLQTLTGFDEPVSVVYHEGTGCLFVADWNHSTNYGPPSLLHRFCGCP